MTTPVNVAFKGEERFFNESKDGYIWMIGKFLEGHCDEIRREPNWSFIVRRTDKRAYIGESRNELYSETPELSNHSVPIGRGLFLATNVSNDVKVGVLARMAKVADLAWPKDWSWDDKKTDVSRRAHIFSTEINIDEL